MQTRLIEISPITWEHISHAVINARRLFVQKRGDHQTWQDPRITTRPEGKTNFRTRECRIESPFITLDQICSNFFKCQP